MPSKLSLKNILNMRFVKSGYTSLKIRDCFFNKTKGFNIQTKVKGLKIKTINTK